MTERFLGNYSRLKRCVLRTRLPGEWRELKNNQKQFRTYRNGILNWWQSTGTIIFQGEKLAALELQQVFTKIASARALLYSDPRDSNEQVDELKEVIAEARIQRRKLKTVIKQARKIGRTVGPI